MGVLKQRVLARAQADTNTQNYKARLAAFFALASLFATPARMLARPLALIFLFGDGVVEAVPFVFAHLAALALASPFSIASLTCFFLGSDAGAIDGAVPLIFAHLAF